MHKWICLIVFFTLLLGASAKARSVIEDSSEGMGQIPFRESTPIAHETVPRLIGGGLAFLFVLVGVAYCLKRKFFEKTGLVVSTDNRIKLAAGKRLTGKMTVFLLAIDDEEYVIVQHGDQVRLCPHKSGS